MPGTIIDANAKVGESVFFGTYPQTAEGNDRTSIEWIVLEVQEDRLFLLSRYGIDARSYNDSDAYVTWETCTLREWLNCEFLTSAFNELERSAILSTELDNTIQSWYLVTGGNNTIDKVFLLKSAEVDKYVNVSKNGEDSTILQMKPTEYALGIRRKREESWLLREPGHAQYSVAYMLNGDWRRCPVRRTVYVRPALWVRLNPMIND